MKCHLPFFFSLHMFYVVNLVLCGLRFLLHWNSPDCSVSEVIKMHPGLQMVLCDQGPFAHAHEDHITLNTAASSEGLDPGLTSNITTPRHLLVHSINCSARVTCFLLSIQNTPTELFCLRWSVTASSQNLNFVYVINNNDEGVSPRWPGDALWLAVLRGSPVQF